MPEMPGDASDGSGVRRGGRGDVVVITMMMVMMVAVVVTADGRWRSRYRATV